MANSAIVLEEPEAIDALAARTYSPARADAGVMAIYDANPGIASLGLVLPAGLRVELPEMPAADEPALKLWD